MHGMYVPCYLTFQFHWSSRIKLKIKALQLKLLYLINKSYDRSWSKGLTRHTYTCTEFELILYMY